ncbi:MAG TPA: hypothetical protein VJ761_19610, partial [Ktedonobacteraceae bacterium]|nr:hypothetical protein [Ktedonobacteraceae bacterium]
IVLLVTRKRNALLQQRVFDALGKTGSQKDKERASRAQEAVMAAEARARAMAELHKRDLDTELDSLSDEQIVEQQLNDLKAQAYPSKETPLLDQGNPHVSPLISPQPHNGAPAKKRASHKPEQQPATPAPSSDAGKELDIARLKKLMEQ